jgi:hypothetical protein
MPGALGSQPTGYKVVVDGPGRGGAPVLIDVLRAQQQVHARRVPGQRAALAEGHEGLQARGVASKQGDAA